MQCWTIVERFSSYDDLTYFNAATGTMTLFSHRRIIFTHKWTEFPFLPYKDPAYSKSQM